MSGQDKVFEFKTENGTRIVVEKIDNPGESVGVSVTAFDDNGNYWPLSIVQQNTGESLCVRSWAGREDAPTFEVERKGE